MDDTQPPKKQSAQTEGGANTARLIPIDSM